MELKEFNKYTRDWKKITEAGDPSPGGNDYNPTASYKPLQSRAGRDYAFKGPAFTRITKKDKQELFRERELEKILPNIESAFEMIIAAVQGTPIKGWMTSQLNSLRRQLHQKVKMEQKRKK